MSAIHKFKKEGDHFRWEDVERVHLEMDGIKGIAKNILIGDNENAPHFIMRYFELEPGGHSWLEQHPHEHEVIVLRGNGVVQIGEQKQAVAPFDVIYVEGNALHQFSNPHEEPFGFVCLIPRLETH
jgi:quercetin dioxygenase-like cupin family protein